MPARRRVPASVRRALRRRRARMGRARIMRRKIVGNGVHFFKEKCELGDWSCAANNFSYGQQTYKIDDLTNFASSMKSLFDLYKILKVKITIFPKFNVSAAEYQNPPGNAGALPLLAVAPNRDLFVPAPVSWADVLNDDGCKVMRLDKPRTFYLTRPKPLISSPGGGVLLPFQFNVKDQPWLTTGGNQQLLDQSTVPHYSHRWAIWNEGPFDVSFHVVAEYTVCFKEQD